MNAWLGSIAAAAAFVVLEMAITHAAARRLRNNGIVDVVWSAGFAGLAALYAATAPAPLAARQLVLLAMVFLWGGRLATHLFFRVRAHHPAEDVRYAQLRREWGADVDRRMFWFFQLQGLTQLILSIPWLVALLDTRVRTSQNPLSALELAAVALWCIALAGESLADRQLARFKADPANRGKVCQAGLWHYSRHPNYFFEWLVWVAYFLFACGSPWGWIAAVSPALMWHFLNNVTGIPMTEELSVRSRGDAYREYQRTTNAFFPWFRRSPTSK